MKFCPVVTEICRGQVHGPRKERIIIIRRRKEAKTISLQTLFVGVTIESYGKLEISYINVDNF
jgi:hypothetical protein